MRRLLPTIAILGAGLLLLLWGLATLEGIVVEERAETKSQLTDARQTLAQYAQRALQGELAGALHDVEPALSTAERDPLVAAENLLLVDGGTQLLPRRFAFEPGEQTPGRELYLALRSGDTDDLQASKERDPDAPWAERLALHEQAHTALVMGDDDAIRRAVRGILEHRGRWVLSSVNDIPAILAMLDDLYEYAAPHEPLVADLLRNGVGDSAATRREGLQRLLLSRRDRFTEPDFRFLAGRVIALSERAGLTVGDFEAQATASPATHIATPPARGGAVLLAEGRWYAQPRPATQFVGVAVDLPVHVAAIEAEMRDRGLLARDDTIALPPLGPMTALSDLQFSVTAPRLDRAMAAADRRFSLKTTFVVLAAALAMIIAVLGVVLQHRSARFVELKSDFVATVSHELRTPLASIRLMAETLERRTAGIARVKDYPTRIVREADELAFLVENILSFNRLDKGRWTPRPSDVEVGPVLDEIVESLPVYGFSDVEVSTEGLDGLVLSVDRELFKLMLGNLVKNACTYNERSPVTLSLRVRRDADQLVVALTDNGVGIPPALQRRVFEDFQRGASGGARGSGLGLSICRKSAEAHGGRIAIAQSGPEGTTFEITLPASLAVG
ncbi:MAG: HAMP domain-containing sensor histidine kinase [Myxococcota bacterium]